jgi:hypothetical protein
LVAGLYGRFYQNVLFVIFVTMDGRKTPWVGYELTREAAMAAFAKSWRRQ